MAAEPAALAADPELAQAAPDQAGARASVTAGKPRVCGAFPTEPHAQPQLRVTVKVVC